jgi:hypothetical protein
MVMNAQNQNMRNLMAMLNDAENSIEASFGLVPRRPMQIPQDVIHTGSTTINQHNLNIDRSTIGVLNTGTVGTLNASMNYIQQENPQLADDLKTLIETISRDQALEQQSRKEVIEQISFLLSQFSTQPSQRNPSVIKTILTTINGTLATSASILGLWQTIEPLLKAHFGF